MGGLIRLVVFLGNPGKEYSETRHNVGWMVADRLSFRDRLTWKEKFRGRYAEDLISGRKVVFLKPLTWMNLSGESAVQALRFFRIEPGQMLVVHDEVELDFGEAALAWNGGLAGHRGLKSFQSALGTREFFRLRIGVARPKRGEVQAHVLGRFSEDERAVLPRYVDAAARLLEATLQEEPASETRRFKLLDI